MIQFYIVSTYDELQNSTKQQTAVVMATAVSDNFAPKTKGMA